MKVRSDHTLAISNHRQHATGDRLLVDVKRNLKEKKTFMILGNREVNMESDNSLTIPSHRPHAAPNRLLSPIKYPRTIRLAIHIEITKRNGEGK